MQRQSSKCKKTKQVLQVKNLKYKIEIYSKKYVKYICFKMKRAVQCLKGGVWNV